MFSGGFGLGDRGWKFFFFGKDGVTVGLKNMTSWRVLFLRVGVDWGDYSGPILLSGNGCFKGNWQTGTSPYQCRLFIRLLRWELRKTQQAQNSVRSGRRSFFYIHLTMIAVHLSSFWPKNGGTKTVSVENLRSNKLPVTGQIR